MPIHMPRTIEVEDIQRLTISPGEILLVTVPLHTRADTLIAIRTRFQENLPEGVKVLMKTADVQVKVISEAGDSR